MISALISCIHIVAGASIRERILKVQRIPRCKAVVILVAGASIRERILKECRKHAIKEIEVVAGASIRERILKAAIDFQ